MDKVKSWLRQPTTVAGISAIVGTLVALVTRQVNWAQAVPLLVGSAVSAILPDDSAARQQAQVLAGTVVAKITADGATAAKAG